MAQTKSAPGWGKAVGILMIIFGALGVFVQIYKLIIPRMIALQGNMMNRMDQLNSYNNSYNEFSAVNDVYGEMFGITEAQSTFLTISGILGFIGCVFYIVGGAKLLTPKPSNLNFAKYALFGFFGLNLLTLIILMSSGNSVLLMVILIYVGMGFTIDLVLGIILLSSDKSAYEPGGSISNNGTIDTVYTRDEVV